MYVVQTIHLLPSDVTAIKKIPGLLRNKQSTYLLINELAATDLSGNQVSVCMYVLVWLVDCIHAYTSTCLDLKRY